MSMIMLIDNWNTWEWTLTKTLSENWALKIKIQLNLFFFDVWLILYVVKHLELALNFVESTLIYMMHKDDRGIRVSYLSKKGQPCVLSISEPLWAWFEYLWLVFLWTLSKEPLSLKEKQNSLTYHRSSGVVYEEERRECKKISVGEV